MKRKNKHDVINIYAIGTFIVLVVVAVLTMAITKHDATKSVSLSQSKQDFSFTGAYAWQQGPTNQTSMALFHGSHTCFTLAEYKKGTVNAAAELKNNQKSLTEAGYTVTPGSTRAVTIQTPSGNRRYQLHQSTVTTPSPHDQKLKGGQGLGYLQLTNGYVQITASCDTASQLPITIPALQAIKLNKN